MFCVFCFGTMHAGWVKTKHTKHLPQADERRCTYGARRVDEHEPPGEPLAAAPGGAHLVANVSDDADLALGLLVLAASEVDS